MKDVFARAKREEIDPVMNLIRKRVEWMDEKGIRQWNVTDYLSVYPRSLFEDYVRKGWLYVLKDESGAIKAAAALLDRDPRWPEKRDKAFYVHHLSSDLSCPGAGRVFVWECEQLAEREGREYLRLDCDVDNVFLNEYYEGMGYEKDGVCVDGPYTGSRRTKKLHRQ